MEEQSNRQRSSPIPAAPAARARRRLVAGGAALAGLAAAGAARAQEWRPTQPVVYTIPAGPGGALDQAVRMIKSIGERRRLVERPFVIENRPGGAGRVALSALDQNPGNPHFLTVVTYSLLTNHVLGELPTTWRDYTQVASLFGEYVTVSVRAESPVRDARDLVERLRQAPESLSIGVATSVGNHIHVGVAKPLRAAGVDVAKLTVVPYKSSQESLTNLLGGHLDVMAATTPNVLAQLQAGRIRVLAVASRARLQGALAAIPTWRELGVDADYESAQGVMAPRGIPREALAFWDRFFATVTSDPEWQEFVRARQWDPRYLNAADADKDLERAYADTRGVLQALGLARR